MPAREQLGKARPAVLGQEYLLSAPGSSRGCMGHPVPAPQTPPEEMALDFLSTIHQFQNSIWNANVDVCYRHPVFFPFVLDNYSRVVPGKQKVEILKFSFILHWQQHRGNSLHVNKSGIYQ